MTGVSGRSRDMRSPVEPEPVKHTIAESFSVSEIERAEPDVLLLQELKCETAAFPREPIEARGYACAVVGSKLVVVLGRVRAVQHLFAVGCVVFC